MDNRDFLLSCNEGLLAHKETLIQASFDIIDVDCDDGENFLSYMKELFTNLKKNGKFLNSNF